MNIIKVIAEHIAAGLSHAEVVLKLDAENGIQVSEAWLKKIIGADGFTHVLGQVGGEVKKVETEVVDEGKTLVEDAKTEEQKIVGDITPAKEVPADHAGPAPQPGAPE